MKIKPTVLLLFFHAFLWPMPGYAQDDEYDSLKHVLNSHLPDTIKMGALDAICDIAPEGEWQAYNKQLKALALSLQKSPDKRTEYLALKYYAVTLNNDGYDFCEKADYPSGIRSYEAALVIQKKIGDDAGQGLAYSNIGAIYDREDDTARAREYYLQALKIQERLNDFQNMPATLHNIAVIYKKSGDTTAALHNYYRILDIIAQYHPHTNILPVTYSKLGELLLEKGKLDSAFFYARKGWDVASKSGSGNGQASPSLILARIFDRKGNRDSTVYYGERSLQEGLKTNRVKDLVASCEFLSHYYETSGNYRRALEIYRLLKQYNLQMQSDDNKRTVIRYQLASEYGAKKAADSVAFAKEKAFEKIRLQRQRLVTYGGFTGAAILALLLVVSYRNIRNQKISNRIISEEKKKSEELLLNILPLEVADELKQRGATTAKEFEEVTVFFTDFVNFTEAGERMSAKELVEELHICFTAFDAIVGKYGIEKIKTIGDAYMAVCGLPHPYPDHAERMVHAAIEIRDYMLERKMELGQKTFDIRIGIHSGPVVAGIVGVRKFAYDVWGDTVNTAARMEQHGEAGKVNVSEISYGIISKKFDCSFRGKIAAKNKGEMSMYFVERKSA